MGSKVILGLAVVLAVQFVALPLSEGAPPVESFYSNVYKRLPFIRPSVKLKFTFIVQLEEPLKPFETIGLTGDADFLGEWVPEKAVILNRTDLANTWSATVRFPANATVNYRYFIGVIDGRGLLQIRKWETHMDGRTLELGDESGSIVDQFGTVDDVKDVNRGWLNSGYILQFKLFRNPIKLNGLGSDHKVFVKVTPTDYSLKAKDRLFAPIVPSGRANVEYVRMEYGNSRLRLQPEYGVPYNTDDILVFHITTNDLKNTAYFITIYVADESQPEIVHTLGYQYLFPEAINGTEGQIELRLMSPTWFFSVGSLRLGYLLVKPLPKPQLKFETSFLYYWRQNWSALDVGHRGLGKSLKISTNAAPIIENTVASMKESGVRGTDIVEFDVQLTSDLVPVIYHDFYIYVCLDSKTPTSVADLTPVLIKDLTYEQLKALKTYQVVGSKVVDYPSHNAEPREDHRLFPTFEDFLTKVDPTIGFDIEIKWPQLKSNGKLESIQTIDKNLYIDRILDVMLRKGCGRLSFFTSFDADICTLLQFKQNMYPVMFLGPDSDRYYEDPRSDTLKQSINNAQAFDLMGIVPHSSNFVKDGNAVKLATNQDVKIFIWGDDSSSTQMVDYFKSFEPTGVIYDRIDLLIPEGKENAFVREDDLPGFFHKQCVYGNGTNATSY